MKLALPCFALEGRGSLESSIVLSEALTVYFQSYVAPPRASITLLSARSATVRLEIPRCESKSSYFKSYKASPRAYTSLFSAYSVIVVSFGKNCSIFIIIGTYLCLGLHIT